MKPFLFEIDYRFTDRIAATDEVTPASFFNFIPFQIYHLDEAGNRLTCIGKGQVIQILVWKIIETNYDLQDAFEVTPLLTELSDAIFKFDHPYCDCWDLLEEFSVFTVMNYNINFIESIELIESYRGYGVGRRVLRSIIKRLYGTAGLWALKAEPRQQTIEPPHPENTQAVEWHQAMNYAALESDQEQAKYKLYHYFKSNGFSNHLHPDFFIGISSDILGITKRE